MLYIKCYNKLYILLNRIKKNKLRGKILRFNHILIFKGGGDLPIGRNIYVGNNTTDGFVCMH